MGKKYKRLYEQICSFQNILNASLYARRGGKRKKPEVSQFEYNLEKNIIDIQHELKSATYKFGGYKTFVIKDPKEREIAKAPYKDRVVHHAFCNIIEPILDKTMIFDSYACRSNKGTHRAVGRAQNFLQKNKYVLKIDIKKYFFTIDHDILFSLLKKKISDKKTLDLISVILQTYQSDSKYYFNFIEDDLFDANRDSGLPIGNLTSQLFANYFLSPFDRFIKEKLKIKNYLRYMDDALIFSNSIDTLKEMVVKIKMFLQKYRLKLNEKKSQIIHCSNGVKFLGFHIFTTYKRLLRENLKRFKKRMKIKSYLYKNKEIDFKNILLSLNSWLGYSGKKENKNLVNKILDHIKFYNSVNHYEFRFIVWG